VCPSSGAPGGFAPCFAAFLGIHLTSPSTAYLEVNFEFTWILICYFWFVDIDLLAQGTWVWLADHDLDRLDQVQVSLYSGRGILSESQGPVWFIGTGALVGWFF